MKMEPSPELTSAQLGAIYTLEGESPFNSVTQEPRVHRIVALLEHEHQTLIEKRLLLATQEAL
jgi:hypothetical protein